MDEREALRAQVETLQQKLHELHATDVNTLRRGYATVAQHVEALKVEASRLEVLVHEVEPDIYTPEFVAEELGKATVVGGASWVLYKLVKTITPLPAKASSWLKGGLFAVTAFVISWRFASSSIGRFAAAFFDHRRRKKAFLKELAELQHRIDVLQALTRSMPSAMSQQHLPALAAPESTGTAAGAAAGPAEGSNNGGREQFVVVDLPRVESGGFVLPSPIASPPPDMRAAAAAAVTSQGSPFAGYPTLGAPVAATAPAGVGAGHGPAVLQGRSVGALNPQAISAAPSSSKAGTVVPAGSLHGPAEPAAAAAAQGPSKLAVVHEQLPSATAQQQLQQPQGQGPGQVEPLSSTGSSSSSTRAHAGSAFHLPDTVMKSGWGGVMQQQHAWQPPPPPLTQQQQQRQQQAEEESESENEEGQEVGPVAAGEWPPKTDNNGEEGVLIEQSSPEAVSPHPRAHLSERAATGSMQRASPTSSTSDDGVLLERE